MVLGTGGAAEDSEYWCGGQRVLVWRTASTGVEDSEYWCGGQRVLVWRTARTDVEDSEYWCGAVGELSGRVRIRVERR